MKRDRNEGAAQPRIVFFFPTRFHLFYQVSQSCFEDVPFTVFSIYPARYFRTGAFRAVGARNRTLWLGLGLYLAWRLGRQIRLPRRIQRLLRRAYIGACETEFRARLGSASGLTVVSAAGYLGSSIEALKRRGNAVFVNHGSLYERAVRDILQRSGDAHRARDSANWTNDFLIDRMDLEFEACCRLIVCSPRARATMPAAWARKCDVVPLGAPDWKTSCRVVGLRRDRSEVTFLHVSGMTLQKNLRRILAAFERLNDPDCRLLLCGPSPEDPEMRRRLLDPGPGVEYLGPRPHHRLPEIFAQADAFIHPSLADGWAMVVTEALGAGLPVVASDQTGAASYYHAAQGPAEAGPVLLVDPASVQSILEGYRRVRDLVRGQQVGRVPLLGWEESAHRLLETVRQSGPPEPSANRRSEAPACGPE